VYDRPSTYKPTTLTCVEWFSMRRVPARLGYVRPEEYKARYHEQAQAA
jgi:hypothetical protein